MEKRKHTTKCKSKLMRYEKELDEIPIVQEFKQSQVDVNDLLQMVCFTSI